MALPMIVFDLVCEREHRFEGWFASGEQFDAQQSAALISCPVCASARISKVPSARIKRAEREAAGDSSEAGSPPVRNVGPSNPRPAPDRKQVAAFIDFVLANSDNVGEKFPEEARRIFFREAPARAIRGTATREETEELLEEGVPVLPLPIPPSGDYH